MPRSYKSTARYTKPEPRFNTILGTKFINQIMDGGKKSIAMKIFYDAVGSDDGHSFVELSGEPGTPLDGLTVEGINGAGGGVTVSIAQSLEEARGRYSKILLDTLKPLVKR